MNTIHHAQLVRDNSVQVRKIECTSAKTEVQDQFIERFGIDDAKELIRKAHNRPVQSEELTLIVRTEFITLEAQNALLKVLEEPPSSTKFIFILPYDFTVLPTLQSRFHETVEVVQKQSIEAKEIFEEFLTANYKERLSEIENAIKTKNLEWQRLVKKGLIHYIATADKKNKSLASLEYVARTLLTRGASNKMLLEHMALIL